MSLDFTWLPPEINEIRHVVGEGGHPLSLIVNTLEHLVSELGGDFQVPTAGANVLGITPPHQFDFHHP
jgi:hypothetical protein